MSKFGVKCWPRPAGGNFDLSEANLMANFIMQPWHLLLAILAGAVHEEQQQVIEYLRTENQIIVS
jgi:hypothetical protein